MPEISLPDAYAVDVYESERDWGQKLVDTKYFSTADEAKAFEKKFNADNTSNPVPDWYMYAQYRGKVA